MTATVYRVRVQRTPRDLPDPEGLPWLARLVAPPHDPFPPEVIVGRFATMPEAVQRGVTAARFVAAGIPWRAPEPTS